MRETLSIIAAFGLIITTGSGCDEDSSSSSAAPKVINTAAAPTVPAATRAVTAAGEHAECDSAKKVAEIAVPALASLLKRTKMTVLDANTVRTRRVVGIIPGAKLLDSSGGYDLSMLPKDKQEKVVFYCYNEQCGAGHAAAERAVLAGHVDVNVLPGGIMGWKNAGNKTVTIQ